MRKTTKKQLNLTLLIGCLFAQFLIPTTALAHGGLAEALLIAGFTIHLITSLVLTFIGTLIFGKVRKPRVFGLSFATTFFVAILVMLILFAFTFAIPHFSDFGFIAAYIITIIVVSMLSTAFFSGAFKK